MAWLGLDVGGANIKASDGGDFARTVSFPMWRRREELTRKLLQVIAEAPECDHIVATMTGELADCFATKAQGVAHIVQALEHAAAGRHLRFYSLGGKFVTPAVALKNPTAVAASNWHALARFAMRYVGTGRCLLVDIGSTTTDILPLNEPSLARVGKTDTARLAAGSLLYTGVVRSPVCAISRLVPYREDVLPIAQELFATMRDVYMILGQLPEDSADNETADGKPATKAHSRARLGRMVCADAEEFHHRDAAKMAQAIADDQARLVAEALRPWLGHDYSNDVVVSGKGEFLARRALDRAGHAGTVTSLSKRMNSKTSQAVTAHALVVLASEARERVLEG